MWTRRLRRWDFIGAAVGLSASVVYVAVVVRRFGFDLFYAALVSGAAVAQMVLALRARTEMGADGIRNRVGGRERFIPWEDIEDVGTSGGAVWVVRRRDHRPVKLAAVEGDPADVVALIASQAGLAVPVNADEPVKPATVSAAPGWHDAPVSLRPSRRPLWWLVTAAVAFPASLAAFAAGVTEVPPLLFLVPLSPFLLLLAVKLMRGVTTVGPDGITNRLVLRRRFLAWDDIFELKIVPTLFGRVVTVRGISRSEMAEAAAPEATAPEATASKACVLNVVTMTLAAPREGLLGRDRDFGATLKRLRGAAGVLHVDAPADAAAGRALYAALLALLLVLTTVIWVPWREPWWRTVHEAAFLPRACLVIEPATLNRLVAGGTVVPDAVYHDVHRDFAFTSMHMGPPRHGDTGREPRQGHRGEDPIQLTPRSHRLPRVTVTSTPTPAPRGAERSTAPAELRRRRTAT